MQKFSLLSEIRKAHFIGIGGISMSGLAFYLLSKGIKVTGSDLKESEITQKIIEKGGRVFYSHLGENIENQDLVIYTSAVDKNNPELLEAKKRGIPILKRSEVLGLILKEHEYSIGVSGSHGKTTATSMIGHMLISANLHPTIFVGGEASGIGNYLEGDRKIAVSEACEYRKNFLDLNCDLAVVLNIDNDHGDCYKNIEEQILAFKQFTLGKRVLVNGDDENCACIRGRGVYTFGIEKESDFMAEKIVKTDFGYSFNLRYNKRYYGRINLKSFGKHNVYNVLSAFAVSVLLKIPYYHFKNAIDSFEGIKRRDETIGEIDEVKYICDYAHHPKEISKMIEQYDGEYKDYLLVFQPHTYSRTKTLKEDFVSVLNIQNPLIIYKTFPAREKYQRGGGAKDLYRELKKIKENCFYLESIKSLEREILELSNGKKAVIFLGAGDIYEGAKNIVKKRKKFAKNHCKKSNILIE